MYKISLIFLATLFVLSGCNPAKEPAKIYLHADSSNTLSEVDTQSLKTDSPQVTFQSNRADEFLKNRYQQDIDQHLLDSASRRFTSNEYDLNGDGKKETIIALSGTYFCGTGGCTAFLLDSSGNLLSKFTVLELPMRALSTSTKGWKDLIVESAGKVHIIKFDGKMYPSNPSVQPGYTGKFTDGELVLDFPKDPAQWQHF